MFQLMLHVDDCSMEQLKLLKFEPEKCVRARVNQSFADRHSAALLAPGGTGANKTVRRKNDEEIRDDLYRPAGAW
jgi:hypothetical protein